jgi:hypothetical protein
MDFRLWRKRQDGSMEHPKIKKKEEKELAVGDNKLIPLLIQNLKSKI